MNVRNRVLPNSGRFFLWKRIGSDQKCSTSYYIVSGHKHGHIFGLSIAVIQFLLTYPYFTPNFVKKKNVMCVARVLKGEQNLFVNKRAGGIIG